MPHALGERRPFGFGFWPLPEDAPKVAVVNQAFAKKFNLGANPIGKHFATGGPNVKPDIQIVGVVQDAKYSDVKREVPPQYFLPYKQEERLGYGYFYIRTATPPEQIVSTIPGVMRRLDASLPIGELKTMEQQIRENEVGHAVAGCEALFEQRDRFVITLSLDIGTCQPGLVAHMRIDRHGLLAGRDGDTRIEVSESDLVFGRGLVRRRRSVGADEERLHDGNLVYRELVATVRTALIVV